MTEENLAWQGKFLSIRLEDSQYGVYEIMTAASTYGVSVMAVHKDSVLLAKQYRPPVKAFLWEFPGGAADSLDNLPAEAARELHEEANVEVDSSELKLLLVTHPMPSAVECTGAAYFMKLPDSFDRGSSAPQESEIEEVAWVPIQDILADFKSRSMKYASVIERILLAKFLEYI